MNRTDSANKRLSALECLLLGVKRTSISGDAMSAYSQQRTFRFPSEGAISGLNKLQMTVALLMSTGNGAISHMAEIGATICFHGRHLNEA